MEQLSIFDFTPEAKQRRRDAYQKLREIADKLDGNGLNVLSLYNGISCGRVALDRAGIKVARYVSYEIDDNANLIAKTNYPNDEYNGDVTTADFTQYKGFDLVIGGSPCTYWSIAKQGRETTPDGEGGRLFLHYVRAVEESECKFFIYENNNSIDASIKAFISDRLGVDFIMINSALVSAQNRERCYWTNSTDGKQRKDRGILIKDVLEEGVTEREKARSLMSSCGRTTTRKYFGHSQGQMKFIPINTCTNGKARTIKANYGKCGLSNVFLKYGKNSFPMTAIARPLCINSKSKNPIGEKAEQPSQDKRIYSSDGKSPAVTTGYIAKVTRPVRLGHIGNSDAQANRVYSVHGKSVCLQAEAGGGGAKTGLYKIDLPDGDYIIDKLTPIECERLQTLPDNYTAAVAPTNRYKGIGNGWTVEVIVHIMNRLKHFYEQAEREV